MRTDAQNRVQRLELTIASRFPPRSTCPASHCAFVFAEAVHSFAFSSIGTGLPSDTPPLPPSLSPSATARRQAWVTKDPRAPRVSVRPSRATRAASSSAITPMAVVTLGRAPQRLRRTLRTAPRRLLRRRRASSSSNSSRMRTSVRAVFCVD